jgi:predicted house-cleaning noncanonical NTP pyrophosphatase (MazG superfamily)
MKKMTKNNRITKSEALAFRKRWETVNAVEKEELRKTPENKKIGQLAMLMHFAQEIGWARGSEKEMKEVRNRWNKLRKVYHD